MCLSMPKRIHKTRYFCLLLILLLSPAGIFAQEQEQDSIAVSTYLSELERTYSIKFSYVDKALEGRMIPVSEQESLEAALRHLASETDLVINQIKNWCPSLRK